MKKFLLIALVTSSIFANEKTICGPTDDRVLSYDSKIGRSHDSKFGRAGCTITMISNNCGISAGHCRDYLRAAQFNTVDHNDPNGRTIHSKVEDTYIINQKSVQYKNGGAGNDWAVFKLDKNEVTGKSAGEVQGFYEVTFDEVTVGTSVMITGYGVDYYNNKKSQVQQTNTGLIKQIGKDGPWVNRPESALTHSIDTMGGNSGSSIINTNNEKIIGIHTHGGCNRGESDFNMGTLIHKHPDLKNAIRNCLASDQ